jgi:hypothetical protein
MLLESMLRSQNYAHTYSLHALADDIDAGRARLLLQHADSSIATDLQTVQEHGIVRLRLATVTSTVLYEPEQSEFMERVLNELTFAVECI